MRFRNLVAWACLAAAGAQVSSQAATGTISYKVGAATTVNVTSEQDITIDVGYVDGFNSPVLVRIWDPSFSTGGVPDDGVGKITITGSYGAGGGWHSSRLFGLKCHWSRGRLCGRVASVFSSRSRALPP